MPPFRNRRGVLALGVPATARAMLPRRRKNRGLPAASRCHLVPARLCRVLLVRAHPRPHLSGQAGEPCWRGSCCSLVQARAPAHPERYRPPPPPSRPNLWLAGVCSQPWGAALRTLPPVGASCPDSSPRLRQWAGQKSPPLLHRLLLPPALWSPPLKRCRSSP